MCTWACVYVRWVILNLKHPPPIITTSTQHKTLAAGTNIPTLIWLWTGDASVCVRLSESACSVCVCVCVGNSFGDDSSVIVTVWACFRDYLMQFSPSTISSLSLYKQWRGAKITARVCFSLRVKFLDVLWSRSLIAWWLKPSICLASINRVHELSHDFMSFKIKSVTINAKKLKFL